MPELFLVPIINVFDVHDIAVRDWLNRLDGPALLGHLEDPFKLDRFFPESSRHALMGVDDVHGEILRLLEIIDPQAVFLDISVDFVELENRYNKMRTDEIKFSNIIEGLKILTSQSRHQAIVIFCSPMHYCALLNALKKEMRLSELGVTIGNTNISALLKRMEPFLQKNRIMQSDYDIALDILGRKKPERFNSPDCALIPA